MRKIIALLILFSLSPLSTAQHAFGGGATIVGDSDFSITAATLSYTYASSDNLKLDIYAAGGGSDSYSGIKIDLDYAAGSKLKWGIPNDNNYLYLSAGYSVFGVSALGGRVSVDGNGATLGGGIDFDISPEMELGLEYSRGFGDIEETNIIGVILRFKF